MDKKSRVVRSQIGSWRMERKGETLAGGGRKEGRDYAKEGRGGKRVRNLRGGRKK